MDDPAASYQSPNEAKCKNLCRLEILPSEILSHILTFLQPIALTKLSATSRHLQVHCHNDLLWQCFVCQNIHIEEQFRLPNHVESWRQLYLAHHPYWFLVRHKIWFSDLYPTGNIIIANFDRKTGSIKAYPITSQRRAYTAEAWSLEPSILISNFQPKPDLALERPAFELDYDKDDFKERMQQLSGTKALDRRVSRGTLSLCPYMPPHLQHPSMSLWPPATIPALQRVRTEDPSRIGSVIHRPSSLSFASNSTFRFNKSLVGMDHGSISATYSTPSQESYTPTPTKPWQGIWVGDYNAHGIEYLLVTQKTATPLQNSRAVNRPATIAGLPAGVSFLPAADGDEKDVVERLPERPDGEQDEHKMAEAEAQELSKIEAIKLTGDGNVPRGEITWFADNIEGSNFMGIFEHEGEDKEDLRLRGSRMVKAMGHIADRGFRDDRFVETVLFLKDHNTIAQLWKDLSHVSFYYRVDLESLFVKSECIAES